MMTALENLDRVSSNYSSSGAQVFGANDEVGTDSRDMADFVSLVR